VPPPLTQAATQADQRGGFQCTILARQEMQQRRPVNTAAIAAMLGSVLLLFALVGYLPCLIILALLAFVMFRFRIFGIAAPVLWTLFPTGQVAAWHFEVFDHDRNASYSVVLLDPIGVAPADRSRVLVRGRMRRNYFQATQILRVADASGNRTLESDGLIARQVPPIWLAGMLLCGGILLNLIFWIR
jgi:hypothetical protein